jgi:hypothetical protein
MSHAGYYSAGLGNAPSYQVSGAPFVSGTIDASAAKGPAQINFPSVTRWVMVVNHDQSNACRVGFSQNGVNRKGPSPQGNYIVLPAAPANGSPSILGPLELKVTQLWLSGSSNVDVAAGLTFIKTTNIDSISVSPNGKNWSGSAGAQVG